MQKFCIVKHNYNISYDNSIINNYNFKNLRIELKYFLCGPPESSEEGIYYRIITSPFHKETCIQNIIFYKIQRFPYHIHDYHPFFIYLNDKNLVKYVIIDDGHHYSKKILILKNNRKLLKITIFLPDHGLTNKLGQISKSFKPRLIPLKPKKLIEWWTYNNMAQIKLRTKLIDPWTKGLIPDKNLEQENLFYRLKYLIPLKIFPNHENDLKFSFRDDAYCPICNKLFKLDFMPIYKDNNSGNIYLIKNHICKNGHQYIIKYNFETGRIECNSSNYSKLD
ncbi:MAG: hypothetical protein ACTSPY_10565 [Candidatus Helarchaeota archaeon]